MTTRKKYSLKRKRRQASCRARQNFCAAQLEIGRCIAPPPRSACRTRARRRPARRLRATSKSSTELPVCLDAGAQPAGHGVEADGAAAPAPTRACLTHARVPRADCVCCCLSQSLLQLHGRTVLPWWLGELRTSSWQPPSCVKGWWVRGPPRLASHHEPPGRGGGAMHLAQPPNLQMRGAKVVAGRHFTNDARHRGASFS